MGKPDSASGSGGSTVYSTVFIDTSLKTHLAMIVSDSDTVSDLKKKILYEHPLCFPNIGKIMINALKVKRKGYLYHLSDSMFVKSAFDGVSKSWFLSVDASREEEHNENHNSLNRDIGNNATCFAIATNNSSANLVDVLPDGPRKRLLNINDSSLPQDADNHYGKQKSVSKQFDIDNSAQEKSGDLPMEVEQAADSTSKVLFPAIDNGSKLEIQEKDVGNKKISEDLPASVAAPVLREKQKPTKREKNGNHDRVVKENGPSAVESGKDALESDHLNKRNEVLNDMNLGNQISVDETSRSVSSNRNKRSAARKRMADEVTEIHGEQSECETNKHKDVSLNEQEYKLTENSSQHVTASKKKHKREKKNGNDNSSIQDGGLTGSDKQGTLPDITMSEYSLGQKLGSISAEVDNLNADSVKDRRRKKRKKQKSDPSEVGSGTSLAKDVHVDTFQAAEAINHKDLGHKADAGVAFGANSKSHLISSEEIQEVSKSDRVPNLEGDDDMVDTDDGNTESKNEAPGPAVESVKKMRGSIDHSASLVNGHPIIASEGVNNLQNDLGVSGHENQCGKSEDKFVKPKKSSKKIKLKKSNNAVGETEVLDAGDHLDPAIDISPAKCPTSLTGDRLNNAEQDGRTDGEESSKGEISECLPSVSEVRADDVIRDVLESLQCNNGPVNAETLDKKSKKKTKKRSSTMDPPELQSKDDVVHRDPIILAEDMNELNTPSKSTRKRKVKDSSLSAQSNGSKLVNKDKADNQLESSQNTLEANHEGRPIQGDLNGYHPGSTHWVDANRISEGHCESERIENQQQHESIDSVEGIVNKVTDKKRGETEVKGKKKKKPDVLPSESTPSLLSSQMLNGKHKKAKSQAAKSSSIQSPTSSSKVEPLSFKVQSSKTLDHEGGPAQDVVNEDQAKGNHVVDANKSIENCRESERKVVGTGEVPVDMVTDKGAVETEVKGKKKKKKLDAQSGGSTPDLPSSKMLNGNLLKKEKAHAAKSSSIQSQRSSSKVEPHSSNAQSSKTLLTVSGNAGREPLQSNKPDTINPIPKEAQTSVDINSSKAKSTRSNDRKVRNGLENKKSLLDRAGTIFKHDDEESSDDEDGVDHSDDSTRTPSDGALSDNHSDISISSSRNGSYNSEGKGGGINRKKPGSSSPKNWSLQDILRKSSRYKKAKITASESQPDDIDSQPDEFVPDPQPK